jgi:hypothetical protein
VPLHTSSRSSFFFARLLGVSTFRFSWLLLVWALLALTFLPASAQPQPRVVISSDFPPLDVIPGSAGYGPPAKRSDPDDIQSMVRFLAYANEFRVEGLIAASATLAGIANKQPLLDLLAEYDRVDEQLRLHDSTFPTAEALRQVTKQGRSGTYGKPAAEILGPGKDSEASEFIIQLLDQPSPDPIWFLFWGGTQELAQALWKVRSTRSPEELARLVSKIRIYMIAEQDGSGLWIRQEFPDIFLITSRNAFKGIFFTAKGADPFLADLAWLNAHVRQNHGPLGALYPESGWDHTAKGVIEGDSPSFLHLLSRTYGLNDPEQPSHGGWGGRFVADATGQQHWSDAPEGGMAVTRWQQTMQQDFAARMEWMVKSPQEVNHPPKAMLNGDRSTQILYQAVRPGQTVRLRATGSSDPDGDSLRYRWWQYQEAGSYPGQVVLPDPQANKTRFVVPADAEGHTIHLILEVQDNGTPTLTRYRRLVLEVKK